MKKRNSLQASLCLLLYLSIIFSIGSISASAASYPVSVASEYEWEVLKIVNQERLKAGKQALSLTSKMQRATDTRVTELLSDFSHTRPDGSNFYTVLNENSITYMSAGENIAAGQYTADSAMESWMDSQGHKENIFSENYQHIGVGHIFSADTNYGTYWAQLFIGSSSNSFSDLKLYGSKSANISIPAGSTLSLLDLVLECTSSIYGTCYL
ncbi:MAG: CAP domain-containing protein, partial [Sporomusa sp.]